MNSDDSRNAMQMRIGLSKSCFAFGNQSKQITSAQAMMSSNPMALDKIHAAFLNSVEWDQNQFISIGWMADLQSYTKPRAFATQAKVAWVRKIVMDQLQPLLNLRFKFMDLGSAYSNNSPILTSEADVGRPNMAPMIRISFDPQQGAFSWVGKENANLQTVGVESATMNLGWLDNVQLDGYAGGGNEGGVVLHEFGHMIGLMHEHQRSDAGSGEFEWASDAEVMKFFTGPPNNWTPAMVRNNVLDKTPVTEFNGSEYDPDSIMHYVLNCMSFKNGIPPEGFRCIKPDCTPQLKAGFPDVPCATNLQDVVNPQHFSCLDKQTIIEKYPPKEMPDLGPVCNSGTAGTTTSSDSDQDTTTSSDTDPDTTTSSDTDPDTTTSSDDEASPRWSTGTIVWVSVIGVIAVICLVLFVYWIWPKKRPAIKSSQPNLSSTSSGLLTTATTGNQSGNEGLTPIVMPRKGGGPTPFF